MSFNQFIIICILTKYLNKPNPPKSFSWFCPILPDFAWFRWIQYSIAHRIEHVAMCTKSIKLHRLLLLDSGLYIGGGGVGVGWGVGGGVSWPSGLAYRTQVLVLAAECGFESRPWHLCPWARQLIIIASLHPGVKWVPVRAELVD